MSYSQLIHGLRLAEIDLDRKILADLAATEPEVFAGIITQAKNALGGDPVETRVKVERAPDPEPAPKPQARRKPAAEAAPAQPAEPEAAPEATDADEQPEVEATEAAEEEGKVHATDAAERKAEELGVDLSAVEGTGHEGRITVGDVEKAAKDGEDG
ncbi:MAG TPA: 50S ribosomal protein L20, partial [Rubrobacter sp.]|nr:50S ribosomal protein L20 [Rubrobacter sp.]